MDESKIIHEIQANVYDLCRIYSCSTMAESNNKDGLSWYSTSIPSPVFNSVYITNSTSDEIDMRIEEIKSYYARRKHPILWWVGPLTKPANIAEHLEVHGFKQISNMPGMAIDLNTLKENIHAAEGLKIELADSKEKLIQWTKAAGKSFGLQKKMVSLITSLELSIGFDIPWKRYTAFLDEEPVGASGLLIGKNTAGIYNVAVAPDYRGKGIGTVLTLIPLLDARSIGCSTGVLQSSPMGLNVYKALGFKEYCKISQYCWKA